MTGSSPLARGLPAALVTEPRVSGIIPARAGFTRGRRAARPTPWDHPRSRGVYPSFRVCGGLGLGSSPLARGLRANQPPAPLKGRIIPARAGFTGSRSRGSVHSADHPRSRGVYSPRWRGPWPPRGSSPLARGLRVRLVSENRNQRIIPARAGFTRWGAAAAQGAQDHPRSRGVYAGHRVGGSGLPGSSPLARGLPRSRRQGIRPCRIIPARAGFTRARRRVGRHGGDHPRSRGVYETVSIFAPSAAGSSPLARGLRRRGGYPGRRRRIIPARAGFTRPTRRQPLRHPDHPRSRGVYTTLTMEQRRHDGSSPLARGLQLEREDGGDAVRIIPARAGFTPARSG